MKKNSGTESKFHFTGNSHQAIDQSQTILYYTAKTLIIITFKVKFLNHECATMSKFTLITCLLIHFQLCIGNWWIFYQTYNNWSIRWSCFRGLLYLLYPLCGLLSQLYLGSFKVITASFIPFVISSITVLTSSAVYISYASDWTEDEKDHLNIIAIVSVLVTASIGLSLYESNAVQFGMDQMIEASSQQLSSFIRWYFWCAHIGPTLMIYLVMGVIVYFSNCIIHQDIYSIPQVLYRLLSLFSFFQITVSVFSIIGCIYYKWNFRIEHASSNPLRMIYNVLKYSYQHKHPERRSAMTYWENDIPSRIDLGKHKYGGPFSYEQVESVKTVLRLLLLMVSLIGFHLSGEGYSLASYIMNTAGCPTIAPYLMFIGNPIHIAYLMASIGIPLFEILNCKCKTWQSVSLLKKMWIGLFICIVNEALQSLYSIMLQEKDFQCSETQLFNRSEITMEAKCFLANVHIISDNSSCHHFCSSPPVSDTVINLSVIIMILYGLSYVLVFTTVLEFICAQSPNETKGLLVGVWYSMLSIKFATMGLIETQVIMDTVQWNVYHGIKGFVVFCSLVVFSIVCIKYKYREKNEIVNEQAIIEAQYERELLLNADTDTSFDSTSSDYNNL